MCSCLGGYIGSPPTCRPECSIDSDCSPNRACSNQKCRDPCPGACGENAQCHTISHRPHCNCPPGFTGNAFSRCYVQQCKTGLCTLITICHYIFCHSSSTTRTVTKSMCTFTLWTKFSVSSKWKLAVVFMFTHFCWITSKLSTGMCQ